MAQNTMAPASRITVFVPVCSGADNLPRLYESLLAQTFKDFEVLIVDDGTTDMSTVPVALWTADGQVKIRVLHQERPGRHLAYNRAIAEAATELFVQIDPDSRLVPEALEVIVGAWDAIDDKDRFAGLVCNCRRENGDLVGTPFSRTDTNNFEMRMVDGITGEKGYVYHTAKLREHALPDIEGENVPDSILHNRVSRGKLLRCIPQALIVRPDPSGPASPAAQPPQGVSLNARILQFNELNYFPMPSKLYHTVNAQYVQLSLLNGRKFGEIVRGAIGKRPMFIAAFMAGYIGAAQAFRRKRASQRQRGT